MLQITCHWTLFYTIPSPHTAHRRPVFDEAFDEEGFLNKTTTCFQAKTRKYRRKEEAMERNGRQLVLPAAQHHGVSVSMKFTGKMLSTCFQQRHSTWFPVSWRGCEGPREGKTSPVAPLLRGWASELSSTGKYALSG